MPICYMSNLFFQTDLLLYLLLLHNYFHFPNYISPKEISKFNLNICTNLYRCKGRR